MRHGPQTDPAFPNGNDRSLDSRNYGLSKREHYAALILAGLNANPELIHNGPRNLAITAIEQAEHLVALMQFSDRESSDDRLTELSRLIPDLVAERDRLIDEARSVSDDVAMEELRSEFHNGEETLLVQVSDE